LCVRVSLHPEPSPKDRRAELLRKFHLIFGLLPLGSFVVLHLSLSAIGGLAGQSFQESLVALSYGPLGLGLEIVGLWFPLTLHVGYGLGRVLVDRSRPPADAARRVLLRRVSAVATLLFLGYHLAEFRVPIALGELDPADVVQSLSARLSSTTSSGLPLTAVLYLIGIAATLLHVCTGLCSLRAAEPSGPRRTLTTRVVASVGIALFAIGAQTVVCLATGSRLLFFG
jgi:succinate dehydrogenase / fumarate reductase, cytochrome b subunit